MLKASILPSMVLSKKVEKEYDVFKSGARLLRNFVKIIIMILMIKTVSK